MEVVISSQRDVKTRSITDIFLKTLPEDFISLLGEQYIDKAYLVEFLRSPKCVIILALEKENIVGFLLACDSVSLTNRSVLSHKSIFIKSCVTSFFKRPISFSLSSLSVAWLLLGKDSAISQEKKVELCYVGILAEYRNKGLGSELVRVLLNQCRNLKNVNTVFVKTLNGTGDRAASSFYKSQGFSVFKRYRNRIWLKREVD